jgi:O-antigen/teichoic acid export membrane protein
LNNQKKYLVKSILDQGVVSISNFLVIVISANVLIPLQHGLMSIVLASLIAIQAIKFPLLYGGSFLYLKEKNQNKFYQQALLIASLFLALISSSIFTIVGLYINLFENLVSLIIAALFIFFQLLSDHIRLEYYTFKKRNMPLIETLLVYSTRIIGAFFADDLNQLLLVLLISNIFTLPRFIALFSLQPLIKNDFIKTVIMHFSLSKNMTFSSILNWGWNYLPIFFIAIFHDVAFSGILLSLKSLSNIHYPLSTLLDTYVPSLLYNNPESDKKKLFKKTLFLSIGIWFILLLGLVYYSSEILALLFGSHYSSYGNLLIMLWLSSGAVIFSKNKVILTRWQGRLEAESVASLYALVIVILIGIPLIIFFAVDGAVVIYLVASIVFLISIMIRSKTKWR